MGRFIKYFDLAEGHNSVTLPQGTTADAPVNPDSGAIRFNTSINKLEYYNGTAWVALTGGVGGVGTITVDSMTLDGLTPTYAYTFPSALEPLSDENVLVFIEGVFQKSSTYTISGSTITLSAVVSGDNGKTLTVIHGFDQV